MEEDEDGHWKLQTLGDLMIYAIAGPPKEMFFLFFLPSCFSLPEKSFIIQYPSPNHYRSFGHDTSLYSIAPLQNLVQYIRPTTPILAS